MAVAGASDAVDTFFVTAIGASVVYALPEDIADVGATAVVD